MPAAPLDVRDIRGLPLDHPDRRDAYPNEPRPWPGRLVYLHLRSHRWYFDASDPANATAAAAAVRGLLDGAAREQQTARDYEPFRVVVDNYGGTVIGQWKEA